MGNGAGEDPQLAQIVCAGSVIAATGVARKARGCTTDRTGAGVYTVTVRPVITPVDSVPGQTGNLSGGIPAAELVAEIQTVGNAVEAHAVVENTSDTVKTVRIEDAASAPLDSDFEFIFKRTALG